MTQSSGSPPNGARAAGYVAALVVYVALGVTTKSVVLNWIVGPFFPLLALYVIPRAARAGWARMRRDEAAT